MLAWADGVCSSGFIFIIIAAIVIMGNKAPSVNLTHWEAQRFVPLSSSWLSGGGVGGKDELDLLLVGSQGLPGGDCIVLIEHTQSEL